MTSNEARITTIASVEVHPDADRLTVYRLTNGATCVGNKAEDGSIRHAIGDYLVFIPEGALIPEWLLRHQDAWNEEKGKGILRGGRGNRVSPINMRGVTSEGMMVKLSKNAAGGFLLPTAEGSVDLGQNPLELEVSDRLCITFRES